MGYLRDPVVSYTTPSGAIDIRRPFWTTRYTDVNMLVSANSHVRSQSDYSCLDRRVRV